MRIVVAGATGVIGLRLIPLLVASNHEVIGTTRTANKGERIQSLGATPLVVDVFDRAHLVFLICEAHPDVIIHQFTDLSAGNRAANARMRKEGTRNLVDAAYAAGVRQFIAQQVRQEEVAADEGVTSFLHIDDAARAAALALDWPPGIVNIVDDNPAKGRIWLPIYAATLGHLHRPWRRDSRRRHVGQRMQKPVSS